MRQGALNWRHYTFNQKANAVAEVQAYLAHCGPGCSVVEACQKCHVNHINFIKWKNAGTMVDKQLKEKKGTKKSTHGSALMSLLNPITGELLLFFEYGEHGMVVDN